MTLPRRDAAQEIRRPRGKAALIALLVALALACSAFTALGIWQLYRLQWKLALIERVDSRIHADPVAAPGPAQWPQISARRDEYLRVLLEGRFLAGHDSRVQALTRLGPGFWILSPLQTPDGYSVLINRGFVPDDWKGDTTADAATVTVTGLLRLSEPKGAFLRHNDAAAGRWYSRDVAALAAASHLTAVAPYFVDAEAAAGDRPEQWPRAGLTVISFPNSHLGYALTWFALALMCAGAAAYVLRDDIRLRRASPSP